MDQSHNNNKIMELTDINRNTGIKCISQNFNEITEVMNRSINEFLDPPNCQQVSSYF